IVFILYRYIDSLTSCIQRLWKKLCLAPRYASIAFPSNVFFKLSYSIRYCLFCSNTSRNFQTEPFTVNCTPRGGESASFLNALNVFVCTLLSLGAYSFCKRLDSYDKV